MARASDEKSVAASEPTVAPAGITHSRPAPLPYEVQRRVEVLQRLEACRGQPTYRSERTRAIQELGVSERSLRRLQQHYREHGMAGLRRQPRSDEGQLKMDASWREFILKTYRKGNRGMRQTSRAQVAKLVESRAAELGAPDYPSRRSVYRILAPIIHQQEQKQKRRSMAGRHLEVNHQSRY